MLVCSEIFLYFHLPSGLKKGVGTVSGTGSGPSLNPPPILLLKIFQLSKIFVIIGVGTGFGAGSGSSLHYLALMINTLHHSDAKYAKSWTGELNTIQLNYTEKINYNENYDFLINFISKNSQQHTARIMMLMTTCGNPFSHALFRRLPAVCSGPLQNRTHVLAAGPSQ
jgi:hypothetical protein